MVNGAGHAKPFRRDIEVFKMDPPTNPYADPRDPGGGWYEHWALEDRGMDKDLKTIELRTFPDEDNPDSAYHMQVVFSLTEDGAPDLSKPLMLSVESPFDLAPLQGMSTGAIDAPKAGAFAEGRHVEDYLYVSDSKTLHGRREGFTVLNVGSRLRSLGNGVSYEATSTQMDPILEIAKDAYVGGKDGPKAAELSPGLEDLVV